MWSCHRKRYLAIWGWCPGKLQIFCDLTKNRTKWHFYVDPWHFYVDPWHFYVNPWHFYVNPLAFLRRACLMAAVLAQSPICCWCSIAFCLFQRLQMLLSKWNISWWQSTNIGGQHEDGSGWCWPNLEMSVSSEKQGNLAHFVQRTTCLVNIVSFSVIFFFSVYASQPFSARLIHNV